MESLRDSFPGFFLAAVVASKEVRWNRVKSDYACNLALFDRDDERDSEDKDDLPHGQQVGRCVSEADYVFINDEDHGSKETRDRKILGALCTDVELMLGQRKREPHEHEVHMAQAWALSLRSRCLKRSVGAVIVDEDGLPLSAGFNENPLGMKPCVLEFQACFKDDIMHKELEQVEFIFCPKCGTKNQQLQKPWRCTNQECREDLKKRFYPSRNMEKCTALHAEERAIRGLVGRGADGATMYVTTFPCLQCSRYIVDAKIKKVVYVEAYPVKEAADYLARNQVTVVPFSGFKARAFNLVFKPTS